MKFAVKDSGVGENGIPWRFLEAWTTDSGPNGRVRALLERGGCCAWQGRTCCDAEPVYVVIGCPNLMFSISRETTTKDCQGRALGGERPVPHVDRRAPQGLRKSRGGGIRQCP